jgi:hypothetical protein
MKHFFESAWCQDAFGDLCYTMGEKLQLLTAQTTIFTRSITVLLFFLKSPCCQFSFLVMIGVYFLEGGIKIYIMAPTMSISLIAKFFVCLHVIGFWCDWSIR